MLSYDEETKYLAAASGMLRDVATIMLETGMRPEGVYRILPANVHLSKNILLNSFGKTKAAKRRIELTVRAKSILERRISLTDSISKAIHSSSRHESNCNSEHCCIVPVDLEQRGASVPEGLKTHFAGPAAWRGLQENDFLDALLT